MPPNRSRPSNALFARRAACAVALLVLLPCAPLRAAPQEKAPAPPSPARHAPKLVFLYPHDDLFWADSLRYAQAAALSLHAQVEPINYESNADLLLEKLDLRLKQGPCDGIIIRFGDTGSEAALAMAQKAGVPLISINSSPTGINSDPRTEYTQWIGQITPQDQQAGAILAQQLTAAARARKWRQLHVLAVSGGRADAAANARVLGFRRQMSHAPEVKTTSVVYGDWDPKNAASLFRQAFRANPQINLVWAANDNMALAIRREADSMGLGGRLVMGGIDWSAEALKAVEKNRLQISVGGHFLEGAMAVVLMTDYLNGRDFAGDGTSYSSGLMAFSSDNSAQLQEFLKTPMANLDFKALSKASNPARKQYTTDVFQIISALQGQSLPSAPFDWRPMLYVLGVALPISVVILVWNRRLAGEIRRRRKVETELIEAKELAEAANRAKGAFLATMSHEIRTPMNGVLGMAELMSHSPLDAAQREQLSMIRGSGESLLAVINDILDYSKIEAGGMEYETIGFSLHELAGRTLQALSPQASAKGLELELDIPADLPDLRLGDPGRLRQVMTNLVGNAIKFTDTGWVRLRMRPGEGPHDLRVEVVDTGEGISQSAQIKLFHPFSQTDASTTRKHGGTGLGLAISARIIKQMGGRIGILSEPGRGSVFWFELALPRASPQEVVSLDDRMPETLPLLAGKRVLLVDGNAVNRAVACAQMRGWGMSVAEAVNGAAALALVEGNARPGHSPYDIAVIDGVMSGMDGWQLAAAIRQIPGCFGMPLIMASSIGSGASVTREENNLFRRFLQKPLRPTQLAGALAEVLTDWHPTPPGLDLPAGHPKRVLLVEDIKANQTVACAMLKKGGHYVEVAENGVEALAKLAQPDLFDVILMDCQMPEMDGFEATRQLRLRETEWGWKRHRVVAMTANAMRGDREACLAAGMDGYLAKPVGMNQLLKIVAENE